MVTSSTKVFGTDAVTEPITAGEQALLDFLQVQLDDSYEIYFQPLLNGDKPDFIIVRPDAGVLIIEVKDWALGAYRVDQNGQWRLRADDTPIKSPFEQVIQYKNNLYELHVPGLLEKKVVEPSLYGLINCAVYFHCADFVEAEAFLQKEAGDAGRGWAPYMGLLARDTLTPESFAALLEKQWMNRPSWKFRDILNEIYPELQRLLRPSLHMVEQATERGGVIHLTPKQQRLVESRPVKQKVRGVAGSGKTVVLARRAVNAYQRTASRVLILTFNITLRNYIRDHISRVRETFPWTAFEILHYHQFFVSQANNLNLPVGNVLVDADKPDFFKPVENEILRYQAIFIDEIQDYEEQWIRTIVDYFLAADGEFVVFGDEKQNIYERTVGADRKPNTTIPGAWNQLSESLRMSDRLLRLAEAFQREFFGAKYDIDPVEVVEQPSLFDLEPQAMYLPLPATAGPRSLWTVIKVFMKEWVITPNDCTILGAKVETLRLVDQMIRNANIRTTTTFETQELWEQLQGAQADDAYPTAEIEKLRREKKFNFQMNAGTIKLSTIHSFKGWEVFNLFLILEAEDEQSDIPELLYTGLTRCRTRLVVINLGNATYDAWFRQHFEVLDLQSKLLKQT